MKKENNPYENMLQVLDASAAELGMARSDYEFLRYPERELHVRLPITMDDGTTRVFEGFRVQHSTVLGPAKGGFRYHQNVSIDEAKALAAWMAFKCAIAGIPYGGSKGCVKVDPSELSETELERLTRAYCRGISPIIGPHADIPAPDVNTNAKIMGWFMDEYSRMKGYGVPEIVTGKPIALGGSLGRGEATGRGVMFSVENIVRALGVDKAKATVAVQGMGNVGANAAHLLSRRGYKIVAVSDVSGGIMRAEGLDMEDIFKFVSQRRLLTDYDAKGIKRITNEELLTCDCSILVPCALENQITVENAAQVKAKIIVEGANGPLTADADDILDKMGVTVVPDVHANGGGVIVSYFEWVQNLQRYYWSEEEVNARLETLMNNAFARVWSTAREKNVTLRHAAYMLAITRICDAKSYAGKL